MRQLQLLYAVTDGDTLMKTSQELIKEMDQVFVWEEPDEKVEIRIDPETGLDPEFDREGLRNLKKLSRQKVGQAI